MFILAVDAAERVRVFAIRRMGCDRVPATPSKAIRISLWSSTGQRAMHCALLS